MAIQDCEEFRCLEVVYAGISSPGLAGRGRSAHCRQCEVGRRGRSAFASSEGPPRGLQRGWCFPGPSFVVFMCSTRCNGAARPMQRLNAMRRWSDQDTRARQGAAARAKRALERAARVCRGIGRFDEFEAPWMLRGALLPASRPVQRIEGVALRIESGELPRRNRGAGSIWRKRACCPGSVGRALVRSR